MVQKCVVSKRELMSILLPIGHVVSQKTTITDLKGIRFLDGAMHGTDLKNYSRTHRFLGDLSGFVVDAKKFSEIIKQMPGDEVELCVDLEGMILKISSGRAKFSVRVTSDERFPDLHDVDGPFATFSVCAVEFQEALSWVMPFISNAESRMNMDSIRVIASGDSIVVQCTDGFSIGEVKIKSVSSVAEPMSFILSREAASAIRNAEFGTTVDIDVPVKTGTSWVFFSGGGLRIGSLRKAGGYPDATRGLTMCSADAEKVTVNASDLVRAVKAVSCVSDESFPRVSLSVEEEGILSVSASDPLLADGVHYVECVGASGVHVTMSPRIMLNLLGPVGKETCDILFSKGGTPLVATSSDHGYRAIGIGLVPTKGV